MFSYLIKFHVGPFLMSMRKPTMGSLSAVNAQQNPIVEVMRGCRIACAYTTTPLRANPDHVGHLA